MKPPLKTRLARRVGRLLKNVHAGEKHLAWNDVMEPGGSAPSILSVTSTSFEPETTVPMRHAGEGVGSNVSPPLAWSGVAAGAVEIVLIVEDTGAPTPRPIVHCLVYGIDPKTTSIGEGRLSTGATRGADTTSGGELFFGKNTMGKTEYSGPRPIPSHGVHTYVFQVFALSRRLSFANTPSRSDLVAAMKGAVIARGRLDGTYER